jgi:hypothetical protein
MIVNGRVVLDSEIWVDLLTPERIEELERAYQANRREERRRIDAKFTRSASAQKVYRNQPVNTHKTDLTKRTLDEQKELLSIQLRQEGLLHFILG